MHAPPPTVTNLYAQIARNKSRWATSPIQEGDPFLEEGYRAGEKLIRQPSGTLTEISFKLTEVLEWLEPDGSPGAIDLLRSALADLERLSGGTPRTPPKPAGNGANGGGPGNAGSSDIKVDRRARPVRVGDQFYPSIMAAARATGRSYNELRAT